MRESNLKFRSVKVLLGNFLFRIREREDGITREHVADSVKVSVRTMNNLENTSFVSCELILRVFHYYVFCGYTTPVEKRLFFYLFDLLRRTK